MSKHLQCTRVSMGSGNDRHLTDSSLSIGNGLGQVLRSANAQTALAMQSRWAREALKRPGRNNKVSKK